MELRAKKSLGQHFLNSQVALAKIIEAARIAPHETVLEIGPGTGVLTRALLGAGAKVVAIEKDARAIGLLSERFAAEIASGALSIHEGDALETHRAELGLTNGAYALVANIPYYITGAILGSFLEYEPRPSRMVLLVQKEVADRIVARDGKESILSISVKAFGEPAFVAKVPRGAFTPAPDVDSAILAVNAVSGEAFADGTVDAKLFFRVVKAGFAHKRKLVRRNLEAALEKHRIDAIWSQLGFGDDLRAEDMKLSDWMAIARAIQA